MQYNFNNILAEFKNGDEFQTPLTFFNKSTLDHTYGTQLFGPYYPSLPVERIKEDANLNTKLYSVIGSPATKDQKDGAADYLRLNAGADYSSWNNNTRGYDQKEVPTLHIIKNEYVDQIYITLLISSLSDTLSQQIVPDVNDKTKNLDPGQKYPGILRIRVEWGVLDPFGVKIDTFKKNRDYIITALVQSPTLIDIGNPDNDDYLSSDYNLVLLTKPTKPAI